MNKPSDVKSPSLQKHSMNNPIRYWMMSLIVICMACVGFCVFTLFIDSEIGLLLTLMSGLIGAIIGLRIYWFDLFFLLNPNPLSPEHPTSENELLAHLDRFLSASPDLFWRIHYASREVHTLNEKEISAHPGYSHITKNARITAIFPARVARQYLEALIEVQSQGITRCFEYQLPLSDKKIKTFEARIQPFSERDCIATIRDITSIKETEKTLFDQQLFVNQIMDSTPFLFFVRDKHGRFLMLNQTAQQILGHGTLVDSHLALIDGENIPFEAAEYEVLEEKQTIRLVDYIILPSGEKRWFEVSKTPLVREKETFVLLTAIDITHLINAERVLTQHKEEYQNMVNQLDIPLAMIDPESFLPTLVNPAMGQLLKKELSQLYLSPLPFFDESLRQALNEQTADKCLRYTISLTTHYGLGKYTFLVQPISYQEKRMLLVIIDTFDLPEQQTHSSDSVTNEPNTKTFH